MSWLSRLSVPWWIAGGWAIDLFAGTQTRPHLDLDVGVLRRDITSVLSALPSWEFFEAKNSILTRLHPGEAPRAEVNSLWGRPASSTQWTLELMLDQSHEDEWIFRRHPRVRRPLPTLIQRNPQGFPHLTPEIQLLYKARTVRPQDQADFARVAPLMDTHARTWLSGALSTAEPNHPWISMLDSVITL